MVNDCYMAVISKQVVISVKFQLLRVAVVCRGAWPPCFYFIVFIYVFASFAFLILLIRHSIIYLWHAIFFIYPGTGILFYILYFYMAIFLYFIFLYFIFLYPGILTIHFRAPIMILSGCCVAYVCIQYRYVPRYSRSSTRTTCYRYAHAMLFNSMDISTDSKIYIEY